MTRPGNLCDTPTFPHSTAPGSVHELFEFPRPLFLTREELRRRVPAGYKPVLHIGSMFAVGLAAVAFLAGRYFHTLEAVHLLLVPAMILLGSLLEYIAHRWLMHRRVSWLPLAWEAHFGRHHHYYVEDAPTWDRPEDIALILFSAFDVLLLVLLVAGPFWLLQWVLAPGPWALVVATAIVYFLAYETLHLAFHLPPLHWLCRLPPIAALRAHHLRHHRLSDCDVNFGVVLPLWDRLFGTHAWRR